ncbi:MAG: AI-2E family transporter [Ruminococcaceae bacterium]|nr:AI-2E family transporter [Oscillospiraceae bacterium]
MYITFSEFIKDIKSSGFDWVKSQAKLSAITFGMLLVGLFIIDIWITPIAWKALIPLIALVIAIIDAVPVFGISITMLPWALILALAGNSDASLSIFGLFIVVLVIKQILEPFVRGKSLGVSPIEEALSAIFGYLIFGSNAIGFIVGPIFYTVGKKVYIKRNPEKFIGQEKKKYFKKFKNNEKVVDITDDIVDVDD